MQGIFRRRRLPHWDVPDAAYFVTTCLSGSIPAVGLREIAKYREELSLQPRPFEYSETEWKRRQEKLVFARIDEWLDGKPGVCHFENHDLAAIVQRSLYHFAGARYHVLAYVIMPSHLHWLFQPTESWCEEQAKRENASRKKQRTPREIIMHSMKSFTSNECNASLTRTGYFWQDESFDHWVRDHDELLRIIEYIEQNPVKAGIVPAAESYLFSSAHDRVRWNVPKGEPLIPPSVGQASSLPVLS